MKNKNLIILGINGWNDKGHDASACLLINDKIVSFVEEERFTRKRYAYDTFPVNAIKSCLEANKLSLRDIDYLAYGWDMPRLYKLNDLKYPYSDKKLIEMLFPSKLYSQERYDNLPKLIYVKHHLAHAASAYYVSGLSDASILVLDGQGEDSSGMLGVGRRGEITILKKFPIQYSLGYFMEAACVFLGMRTSDAGKLMGLAGHGKPIFNFSEFKLTKEGYEVGRAKKKLEKGRDQQEMVIKFWLKRFNEKFPQFKPVKMEGFNRLTGLSTEELIISDFSKNFAASVQKELETVILHLASTLIRRTGEKKLVYAGGIALNCTTNGRIISEGYAEDLYIQPAANDAGVSLGAALHVAYAKGKFNFKPMQTCYYGPEFTDREIEQELKRLKVFYRKEKNISRKTAKEISIGKVVAWFQGKMEVGPRALGSRSIVANPMLEGMNNVVNIIKSREQWRPLAPSVMEEDIDKFFEKAHKNPFMLFTHFVNSKYKKIVPAIVHVDGTTRFQSVSRKVNKNYYNLIDEFGKITGVPIILNTSLNIGGEPIVMTPKQALAAFYNSPIDCLAIGNFWIQKYEKK